MVADGVGRGSACQRLTAAIERVLSPESVLVLVGDVAMGEALGNATWDGP